MIKETVNAKERPQRRRHLWTNKLADWRCYLCGRSAAEIGVHPLPVRQRAHLLPNRLTGNLLRYNGVKNRFQEDEWTALLTEFGSVLETDLGCTGDVRAIATAHCYELCGECHEEVLSEPVYLPSVMRALRNHFTGASRIEKVIALTRILQLGAAALDHQRK